MILLFAVNIANAKVTINPSGGYEVTITDSGHYGDIAELYIVGSFNGWETPGTAMEKDPETGHWTITMPLTGSIKYKFYDPSKEGDDAYTDDLDPLLAVDNPFGSKDYIVKMPATDEGDGGTGSIVFGLWSRTFIESSHYINTVQVYQNDEDGVKDEDASGLNVQWVEDTPEQTRNETKAKFDYVYDKDTETNEIESQVNAWYNKLSLDSSTTLKIHGEALPNFIVDIEVNAQNNWGLDFSGWYDITPANMYTSTSGVETTQVEKGRSRWLEDKGYTFVSTIFDIPYGPYDVQYFDMMRFGWKYDDFEIYIGARANKKFSTSDPVSFISGDRTGNKDVNTTNLEAYIHPTALKGFWYNVGLASSTASNRTYMFYNDLGYKLPSLGDIGLIYYFNSYSPTAIDAVSNAKHMFSVWTKLKPEAVSGLTADVQYGLQLPTRYFQKNAKGAQIEDADEGIYGTDLNVDKDFDASADSKVILKGYDPFANMAINLKVGYSISEVLGGLSFAYTFDGVGAQFQSDLADGSLWSDDGDNNMPGAIRNKVDFSINPIASNADLLKIDLGFTNKFSDMKSIHMLTDPVGLDEDLYGLNPNLDDKKWNSIYFYDEAYEMTNTFKIGLESKLKIADKMDFKVSASAEFEHLYTHDNALNAGMGADGKGDGFDYTDPKAYDTGIYIDQNFLTFKNFKLGVEVGNISEPVKQINFDYIFNMNWYDPYAEEDATSFDAKYLNMVQWKNFSNQWIAKIALFHDITVELGGVFRYYHGTPADKWTFNVSKENDISMYERYNVVPEYSSWGIALGMTYIIPVEVMKSPTLFFLFSQGWDAYDWVDDKVTSIEHDNEFTDDGWNEGDGSFSGQEAGRIIVGLKWDF